VCLNLSEACFPATSWDAIFHFNFTRLGGSCGPGRPFLETETMRKEYEAERLKHEGESLVDSPLFDLGYRGPGLGLRLSHRSFPLRRYFAPRRL